MEPRAIDSLDTGEVVMAIEEAFEVELPDVDEEAFSRPDELVDWLEAHLANQRPNKAACALLKKLSEDQQQPELVEGLERSWRREQIAAIVREVLR